MSDESCRLAKLEANQASFMTEFREHCRREEEAQRRNDEDSKERLEILLEVRDKQAKMSGFWAGATMVITALATVGGILFNKFFDN